MASVSIRFVPIERWPLAVPKHFRRCDFDSPYDKTLGLLKSELEKIGASAIVIQAFFRRDQLRQDGWPYASANPEKSGVILGFRAREKGDLSFPCWSYPDFRDNLRAIALSLQALRAVDRYGVTQRAEQYQGWKQIEQPKPAFASRVAAARFVAVKAYGDDQLSTADDLLTDPDARKRAYRSAAALLHPDTQNGSHEEFVLLQAAMAMLEAG